MTFGYVPQFHMWTESDHEECRERAAILELEAGLTRNQAELRAREIVDKRVWRRVCEHSSNQIT
jgi:hypothetical protein